MHLALLTLLPLALNSQPSLKVEYYGAQDSRSLLVIVTKKVDGMDERVSHAKVTLRDKDNNEITHDETDLNGEVIFRGLTPAKYPIIKVDAEQELLSAPGVTVPWRLVMPKGELQLHPEAPPSNATLRQSYPMQAEETCMRCEEMLCCSDSCCPGLCDLDHCYPDACCGEACCFDPCCAWLCFGVVQRCSIRAARGSSLVSNCARGIPYSNQLYVGAAALNIMVPEDAMVSINGHRTAKTGTQREYYSVGLKPGRDYKYVVRAQIVRGGKVVEKTREVILHTGDRKSLALHF